MKYNAKLFFCFTSQPSSLVNKYDLLFEIMMENNFSSFNTFLFHLLLISLVHFINLVYNYNNKGTYIHVLMFFIYNFCHLILFFLIVIT